MLSASSDSSSPILRTMLPVSMSRTDTELFVWQNRRVWCHSTLPPV